jgi:hypothetical protein
MSFALVMHRPRRTLAACALLTWMAALAQAQPADQPAAEAPGAFRRIAPGIERTIAPAVQKAESYSWMQKLDELSRLAADQQVPELGKRVWAQDMLKDVRLEHDVWSLEFTFKPVRFVTVDVPSTSGQIERKLVWYLIYHVRNLSEKPVHFVPQFVLHSIDQDVYYPTSIIRTASSPRPWSRSGSARIRSGGC